MRHLRRLGSGLIFLAVIGIIGGLIVGGMWLSEWHPWIAVVVGVLLLAYITSVEEEW